MIDIYFRIQHDENGARAIQYNADKHFEVNLFKMSSPQVNAYTHPS